VKTNFEGKAVIHVTKNTEFYKFLIYYDGELKKTTNPTYIYEDTITFQIQLQDEVAENFFITQDITYSLTYNDNTQNMKFQFSDSSNTITNGILEVYAENYAEDYLYDSTTLSSTSGSILIFLENVSNRTYVGKAFVTVNGEKYFLTQGTYTFTGESPLSEEKDMIFLVTMVAILFATSALIDIKLAVLLTPLPFVFASLLNLIKLKLYITLPLEILGIIIVGIMAYSQKR